MSGEVECSVCHAKVAVPAAAVSKAYDSHRSTVSSRQRALNVLLVSGDCVLAGLQVSARFLPLCILLGLISVFSRSPMSEVSYCHVTTVLLVLCCDRSVKEAN